MGLEGNYRQIGKDTLKELYNSLKNDNKIDKKEFDKIKLALMADGNKTKGEIDLLNKIEDCLNKNEKIKPSDFEPRGNSINFDLKISNKNAIISDSKEEKFNSKIPIEKICNFLDNNFDKLKNKDGRIDLQGLESSIRSKAFSLDEKLIIDRVTQNLDLFLNKEIKNFSDITLPPYGISKDDTNRVKGLLKNQSPKEIENKISNLENNTFRSDEHLKIIDKASKVNISNDSKEWTNLNVAEYLIKNKGVISINENMGLALDSSRGEDFINDFKDNYIKSHKAVIKEASKLYGVPEKLLAGVLHREVGGDPYIIDNISYEIRKNLPDSIKPIIKNIPKINTLSADKQLTSFGNVSIQIRRAKESLGYSYKISDKQEEEIIKSLENPKESIFICAKHLKDLKQIDFKNKTFNKLSNYELAIIATRYNVGPGDTRERLSGKGFGYGQGISDNFDNISKLLK